MAGRDRQSKDQQRRKKLAERAKRRPRAEPSLAYDGKKYQADEWVEHVYATERAIYETIQVSNHRLTNDHVRAALTDLVHRLQGGEPPLLPEGETERFFEAGREVEFLTWLIRVYWRKLVEREGPVAAADFVGLLRTLLNSIDAHEGNTGPRLGYVAFLDDFIGRIGQDD